MNSKIIPTDNDLAFLIGNYTNNSEATCRFYEDYVVNDKIVNAPPIIKPFIVDAWKESKKRKLSPYIDIPSIKVKEILGEGRNPFLIKEIVPLLREHVPILNLGDNISISLFNKNGLKLFSHKSKIFSYDENGKKNFLENGSIEFLGASSHSLAAKYKRTVALTAYENYNRNLQALPLAISIPIIQNDEVFAVLSLGCYKNDLFDTNVRKLLLRGFQCQCMLSSKIKDIIELNFTRNKLKDHRILLDSLGSITDDAIIGFDNQGNIFFTNDHIKEIFNTKENDIIGSHYTDYFGKQSSIEAILKDKPLFFGEENAVIYLNQDQYNIEKAIPVTLDREKDLIWLRLKKGISRKSKQKQNELTTTSIRLEKDNIVGNSPSLKEAKRLATRFAKNNNSILLRGESGTGKELFARLIHEQSRPEGPFIPINCAAIPESLIESELFGYEAGSFTGAERKGRLGKFEMAQGGTLFLDEIGDMPLNLQSVLLRVLEDKQVLRIGGKQFIDVDIKVVAATNKDLEGMIAEKQFREDLYYRIATFEIMIPPVRDRLDDVISLANIFIKDECEKQNLPLKKMSSEVINTFFEYEWPGNVRELKNAIIHAVNIADSDTLTLNDFNRKILLSKKSNYDNQNPENDLSNTSNEIYKRNETLAEIERKEIIKAYHNNEKNVTKLAETLDVSRATLYRKLKQYGIIVN